MASIFTSEKFKGIEDLHTLQLSDVTQVYSGKDGRCCCGCSGTHSYPSTAKVESWQKVNDKEVKRIFGILKKNASEAEFGGNHFSVVIGQRLYIAYVS